MAQPQENNPNTRPNPIRQDDGKTFHPKPDVEINPASPGNDTEVDLDKNKTKTYPGERPPERH
jgi:hypothetical protein